MLKHSPLGILRTQAQAPAFKGQPSLLLSVTSDYDWLYDDSGSGAYGDVGLWRPKVANPAYFIVGDYAQGNHGYPTGSALIVTAINDDPQNPLLKAPLDFILIWNDRHSGGTHDGSIWRPKAPEGYLALGDLGASGHGTPDLTNYRCIRKDLVVDSEAGTKIWDDTHSGAYMDVAIYQLLGVSGAFVAQGNHNPYSGPCHKLAGK